MRQLILDPRPALPYVLPQERAYDEHAAEVDALEEKFEQWRRSPSRTSDEVEELREELRVAIRKRTRLKIAAMDARERYTRECQRDREANTRRRAVCV